MSNEKAKEQLGRALAHYVPECDIERLEQKNKELMDLLEEWEVYLEEHKKVIKQQAERIKEFEAKKGQ